MLALILHIVSTATYFSFATAFEMLSLTIIQLRLQITKGLYSLQQDKQCLPVGKQLHIM